MKTILFQGDSITDAGRYRETDHETTSMGGGYPLLLKARLMTDHPSEYHIINRGVSGDRIVDVYARMLRDIVNLKPDYLSILIGVNDVWHGIGDNPNGVAADKFEKIYDMLLSELRDMLPDCWFIILEPFVLPGPATLSDAANPNRWETFSTEVPLRAAAAKRVADKHKSAFVPLQDMFDKRCETAEPTHWLRDGVHPTEAGHECIAREWMKVFETLV
ncbi:MAG: SGNH/GDSL hydrolase family protein [Clostridia bacterium]|nr:SGNH/GDSL hydrolase family protein [Clostridia bacterium]